MKDRKLFPHELCNLSAFQGSYLFSFFQEAEIDKKFGKGERLDNAVKPQMRFIS